MFSNRKKRLSGGVGGIPACIEMEMRTGGPEMAGAPRDLGQSPSTGQSIPTSEEQSARDARCYTKQRHRAASNQPMARTLPPSSRLWRARRRPGCPRTAILRNEAICNVEEIVFMWHRENGLRG